MESAVLQASAVAALACSRAISPGCPPGCPCRLPLTDTFKGSNPAASVLGVLVRAGSSSSMTAALVATWRSFLSPALAHQRLPISKLAETDGRSAALFASVSLLGNPHASFCPIERSLSHMSRPLCGGRTRRGCSSLDFGLSGIGVTSGGQVLRPFVASSRNACNPTHPNGRGTTVQWVPFLPFGLLGSSTQQREIM